MSAPPVSILIPAYHERHFPEAFSSALAQAYAPLEIVVCDDSPGEAIERTVSAARDARVRYERNPARLGFHGNFTRCFDLARGELVKFLNDDDRLRPDCVAGLAAAMRYDPRVTLALSRRAVIDDAGRVQPDTALTAPLSRVSCMVPGTELGDFVLVNSLNVIGEPTTAMFRKRDVALEEGSLFSWGGVRYHVLADLSLWLRLLARGAAFYQAPVLSEFRMHAAQEQRGEAMDVASIVERLQIVRRARAAGFLGHPALYRAAISRVRERGALILATPGLEPSSRQALARVDAEAAGALQALPA